MNTRNRQTVGIVVIGRNEGERLAACLRSVRAAAGELAGGGVKSGARPLGSDISHGAAGAAADLAADGAEVVGVVYVDSHSQDNSVATARGLGAQVVELNPAGGFTAAKARNAGAEALLERYPEADYLQFLDGDTELHPAWLGRAVDYLDQHPEIAVACGRRREKEPALSVYNRMADMEWNTPIGEAGEFGGDAMIRARVFQELHGYSPTFIAGEEPEFAARMRLAGHGIVRLDGEMTRHDLRMTKFSQWFRRTMRSGHAAAQLFETHGAAPLLLYQRQHRSILLWTSAVPAAVVAVGWGVNWWGLLLLPLAYAWLWSRIVRYRRGRGDSWGASAAYALFTVAGKFPQLLGMMAYYLSLVRGRQPRLMEYKGSGGGGGDGRTAVGGRHPAGAVGGNT